MDIITDKAKIAFNKQKRWFFNCIDKSQKLLSMYRWFNAETNVKIDIHSFYSKEEGTYYQWFVTHPFLNQVYSDKRDVNKNPHLDFDECLAEAIEMANKIYNVTNW